MLVDVEIFTRSVENPVGLHMADNQEHMTDNQELKTLTELFGGTESACHAIVNRIRKVEDQELFPAGLNAIEAVGAVTKSGLLRFMFQHEISLEEIIPPVDFSSAQTKQMEQLMGEGIPMHAVNGDSVTVPTVLFTKLRLLSCLCAAPKAKSEEEKTQIREIRERFRLATGHF